MVLFPRVGAKYWYVTDMHETFFPVLVTVKQRGDLLLNGNKKKEFFTVELVLVPAGYAYHIDDYAVIFGASRRDLYRTERQATRVAARLNKEAEMQ